MMHLQGQHCHCALLGQMKVKADIFAEVDIGLCQLMCAWFPAIDRFRESGRDRQGD